jgi:2'-5' RNA ligase
MNKSLKLISLLSSLLEEYKHASLQYTLPRDVCERIQEVRRQIPLDDIYEEEDKNADPHVTLFYGLDDDDMSKILSGCKNFGLLQYTLDGKVQTFDSRDYHAIYLPVKSEGFHRIHEHVKQLTGKEPPTFKTYKPHANIAYVKRGRPTNYAVPFTHIDGTTQEVHFFPKKGETPVTISLV